MALVFVSSTQFPQGGNTNGSQATLTVAVNDLLVVEGAHGYAGCPVTLVDDNLGNTWTLDVGSTTPSGGNYPHVVAHSVVTVAGSCTVTLHAGCSVVKFLTLSRHTGPHATPYVGSNGFFNTTSSAVTGSVTTPVAGCLGLSTFVSESGGMTFTAGSGTQREVGPTGQLSMLQTEIQVSAGAFQATATESGASGGYDAYISVFKPAAGGSTTTTQTETGVARIQKTTTKTETGVSRIQNTTTKTETGLARVQKVVSQNESGVSKITATTAKTESGVARVQKTSTATETGLSRITAKTLKTETGVANIVVVGITSQPITGKAKITAKAVQTESGLARIQKTTSQSETGVSKISLVTLKTETGISRITQSTSKTETGVANIRSKGIKTITGKARIITGGTTGFIKVYLSGVWVLKPIKVFTFNVWVQKPVKFRKNAVWN